MAHFVVYNTSDATTGNLPLAANGTWASGQIQPDRAQQVAGSVFSDVAGTLFIDQSFDDGNNWDITNSVAVTANTVGPGFSIAIIAPLVRLRYVNGPTIQTVFRLFARTYATGR